MKTLKKVMIRNRYAKPCHICGQRVGENKGWARLEDDEQKWRTYCDTHCPEKKAEVVRKITVDGRVFMPYEPQNLPLLKSLPGARWNGEGKYWTVSVAKKDLRRVVEVAERLKLEVPEELICEASSNSIEAQRAMAEGLYPYQVDGVHWLSVGDKRLLGDEMGLGKTVQCLAAVPKGMGLICVVPSAVKYNWGDEAAKWAPHLKPTYLCKRGEWKNPEPDEMVITTFDILPDWLEMKKINPQSKPWELEVKLEKAPKGVQEALGKTVVIIDEVQRVKNYKAQRSKRVKGLTSLAAKVWALTGTPMHNKPADLFGMLDNVNMQFDVFYGWKNFCRLMGGMQGRFGTVWGGDVDPQVPELMRRIMLRRLREDVLPDLPKKTFQTLNVDLDEHLLAECDRLWQDQGEDILEALEQTPDQARLPKFEVFSEIRAKLASSRIPAAVELVEEHEENGIPLVVFSAHKEPVKVIGSREGWAYITGETPAHERQEIVRQFQAGNYKGLACTIKAGGVGLTMTRAWKAIFVDLDWVPGENSQAEDRICRIGQTMPCQIVRLVSNHILDKHVLRLLVWKMGVSSAALDQAMNVNAIKPVVKGETNEEYEARMKDAQEHLDNRKQTEQKAAAFKLKWTGKIERDSDLPF